MFRQNITCSALLDFIKYAISCTGLSPTTVVLSRTFHYNINDLRPAPRSLAATYGISVDFFSSGYLDVSVPRVRPHNLCIQLWVPQRGGFPHSEIPGSKLVYQLPEAYRRLLRPSSPVAAKASTMCAYSLDHITPSTLSCLIFSALASLFCSFVRSHTCVCSLSRSQNASPIRKTSAHNKYLITWTFCFQIA